MKACAKRLHYLALERVFEGMAVPFGGRHECNIRDAIFVNGISKKSYPINNAFEGWKQGFDDTKSGIISAHLDVRFSQRLYDNFSAHETGIFHYYTINKEGKQSDSYVHFESLWVKKNNKWLMIMEYQKSRTDKDEWDVLR